MNKYLICKCGCKRKAIYLVESQDFEGNLFKEPCCINSAAYLKDCANEFDKSYKETYINFQIDIS